MVKDIRNKDAFFTIADRAGYPAIVAIHTVGKVGCQLLQAVCGVPGFDEHSVAIGRSFRYDGFHNRCAFRWFGRFRQFELVYEFFADPGSCLNKNLSIRVDAEKP